MNVRERITKTCLALGPELVEKLTLVGGSRQALLPLIVAHRPTKDVDFIVKTASYAGWAHLTHELEDVGFRPSKEKDAPICRYERSTDQGLLLIDVMSTTEQAVGFANRWYPAAHEHRIEVEVGSVRCFASDPIHHLLTKIDAFSDRGAGDPISSHDLEDITSMLIGMESLLTEIEHGESNAHASARDFLATFVRRDDAHDLLLCHADSSAQHLVTPLLARLHALRAS